jgi:hypothetical protein
VKRINISYGGEHYTIADSDPDDVKEQINQALIAGKPFWLRVNHGEGTVRAADILITAGTAISIVGIERSGPTDTPNSSDALASGPSDASITAHNSHPNIDGIDDFAGVNGL